MRSRYIAWSVALGLALQGCGPSATVQIPPTASTDGTPGGPGRGGNGDPTKPGGEEPNPSTEPGREPSASPTPSPVREASYRLLCEKPSVGSISTTRHRTLSNITAQLLSFEEVSRVGSKPTGDRSATLLESSAAVGGPGRTKAEMVVLFTAARPPNINDRRLYFSRVDLTTSPGAAVDLGRAPAPSSGASSFANKIGLNLKSYGLSDEGNFAIVKAGDRFSLLSTKDLSLVGTIPLNSSTRFMPALEEKSGTLVFLAFESGVFVPEFHKLTLSSSGLALKSLALVRTASGHTAFAPPAALGSGEFAWATAARSDLVGPAATKQIRVARYDATSNTSWGARLTLASGERAALPIATYLESGRLQATMAVERSQGSSRAGRVVTASFESDGRTEIVGTIDYPEHVYRNADRNGGVSATLARGSLASPGSNDVLVFLPDFRGLKPVRVMSSSLEDVIDDDCFSAQSFQEAR